jgi:hypothetical protein
MCYLEGFLKERFRVKDMAGKLSFIF